MMKSILILCSFILLLGCSVFAQQLSQATPLPCTRAKQGDTQPWVHNSKVLDSFPSENPLPRFIGAFRDKNWSYWLKLYQNAKGVFGELSSPVLDADSPTSRLYDATFDSRSGALQFSSHFRDGELQFTGVLRGRVIGATLIQNNRSEKVTLKRVRHHDDNEVSYTSRAQFDCAMTLWRRF